MAIESKASVYYKVTDSTKTEYTFPFLYLRKFFVKVQRKEVLNDVESLTTLAYGVDYTITDNKVTLSVPAPINSTLIIFRRTDTDRIVEWADASILRAYDMNTATIQQLHILEELQDYVMVSDSGISGTHLEVIQKALEVEENRKHVDEIADNMDSIVTEATAALDKATAGALSKIDTSVEESAGHAKDAQASANQAKDAASNAFASTAPAWDSTKTYNYPDVVAYTDGNSYRCIGTNVTGTEIPDKSNKWVRVTISTEDFWEVDVTGGVKPSMCPSYSHKWDLDNNGDLQPKGED